MTNNLNEQVEQNQTNQTSEANQQNPEIQSNETNQTINENNPIPPSTANVETSTPPTPPIQTPSAQKENFMHKYPNLWKYLTTGVLSFIAGMLIFSFASSLKQNHRQDRVREMTQQMPTKSNKGQRQAPTHDQSAGSTQTKQPTQSTTDKTI